MWLMGDPATDSALSGVTASLHGCDTNELNQTYDRCGWFVAS